MRGHDLSNRVGVLWRSLFGTSEQIVVGSSTYVPQTSGTFIPTLAFGGASTGITYANQNGNYVKHGAVVHFAIRINLSSKGSATGDCTILGLPFTSANIGGIDAGYATLTQMFNMSSMSAPVVQVPSNATALTPKNNTATGTLNLTHANFNNNSHIYLVGSYRAA